LLLETDRKLQQTNQGSMFVIIDKQWAKFNNLKKGEKIKMFSGSSISVLIAPNSPLATKEGLEKFKSEILKW